MTAEPDTPPAPADLEDVAPAAEDVAPAAEDVAPAADGVAPDPAEHAEESGAVTARAPRWLQPASPALIYAGVVLIIGGFGVLAFTWSRVAGTAIIALQLPYIASGGFAGLGLVIVGVLSIHLAAKRRDAWQRDRRLTELASALEAIASRREAPSTGGDVEV